MNSQELEQSLRAEFETYLKDVLAEMKQDVSDFQAKIESEFEKHRSQLREVFEDFSKRHTEEREIETSFKESVSEHLKLARDEGARITAAAIAEAEEMREEEESPANFSDIRDAINEISSKDSQSEILKSLVHHAAKYTPQGAFFIVKNNHLVGWRVFGTDEHPDPEVVKEVYFPMSLTTSLSESVNTLATVESAFGTHEDDLQYLQKLGFGKPANMFSIPLVVRGRGVAVLHADRGSSDAFVNVEAIEALVRVAGLTVEVLASANAASKIAGADPEVEAESESAGPDDSVEPQRDFEATGDFEDYTPPETEAHASTLYAQDEYETVSEDAKPEYEVGSWSQTVEPAVPKFSSMETETEDYSSSYETISTDVENLPAEADSFSTETEYATDIDETYEVDQSPTYEVTSETASSGFEFTQQSKQSEQSSLDESDYYEETPEFESESESQEFEPVSSDFDDSTAFESEYKGFEPGGSSYDTPVESFDFDKSEPEASNDETADTTDTADVADSIESAVNEVAAAAPLRPRFGDRNVDLPIEVAEDERRYHNDARRFARLLVSEIKLYNEQKVKEGRETSNLYERLREAIDRSREMYDKRVQPPVAAKFDYFNYELVNTLAEGDENKLGGGYPGANV